MRVRAVLTRLPASVRWGAGAYLLTRGISSAAAAFALRFLEIGPTVPIPNYSPPVPSGLAAALAGVWLRADALWYLRIAAGGYGDASSLAFFPLFPGLVRVATPLFAGNELFAALLVSNAACLAGFVLLFRLFDSLAGSTAAQTGVVALAVFPTSFFLVAPYAEPLLVAASAGALLNVLKGRPLLAFAFGAAAALTRPFGVLIAIPMLAFAWQARPRRQVLASLGPLIGAGVWAGYVAFRTGDLLGAIRVQSIWQREPSFPTATIAAAWDAWWASRAGPYGPYFLFDLAAALFGLALSALVVVYLRRKRPWAGWGIGLFGVAACLIPMMTAFPPRPLMSFPRFVLALAPAFLALAMLRGKTKVVMAVLSSAGLFTAAAVYVAARPLF